MSFFDERRGGYDESKRWGGNGSSSSSNVDKFVARLYVGRLSRSVSERDIDEAFGKYGRIREVDMKIGFCFVQFDDPRDADDAMRALDGVRIPGNDERILVEFARGSTWRGARDSSSRGGGRNFDGRSPERCFNCGQIGHWARDCGERSRRYEENRCFTCGQPGHRARDCVKHGSSTSYSRGRSRSPYRSSRDRSPRRYSRSPYRSSDRDRDRDRDRERDRDRDRDHDRERDRDKDKDKDKDRDYDKDREKDRGHSPERRSASPRNSRRSPTPH